ncbi:F-box protein At2g26850-like [Prosopis cineraria]|uniref:F-box protein At2g26850-like n=1 Tax=Prosopis cineraria TaxID=364024 RepID=UPI002410422B|nr:F-box protein At2g26850-like [Prosopis cineraria]
MGKNIGWEKVRATPVETPPNAFHVSNLNNLTPADHIEIQFRTARQTSYDWWYATIGHLETCDENENHCRCDQSDMVVVEFKQYSLGSQIRRLVLRKNNNREHDDGMGRLYGGIRKIHSQQQINMWKRLFPPHHVPDFILSMPPVAAMFLIP